MGNGTRCISLSNSVPVGPSRDPCRNCLASWPADLARSGARASLLPALSSLRARASARGVSGPPPVHSGQFTGHGGGGGSRSKSSASARVAGTGTGAAAAAGAERGHLCGVAVAGGGGGVPASPAQSPEEGAPPSWSLLLRRISAGWEHWWE